MKIAYLMHSDRKYDEVVETINQLTKQGDHVFIMINDDDLREPVSYTHLDVYKRQVLYPVSLLLSTAKKKKTGKICIPLHTAHNSSEKKKPSPE